MQQHGLGATPEHAAPERETRTASVLVLGRSELLNGDWAVCTSASEISEIWTEICLCTQTPIGRNVSWMCNMLLRPPAEFCWTRVASLISLFAHHITSHHITSQVLLGGSPSKGMMHWSDFGTPLCTTPVRACVLCTAHSVSATCAQAHTCSIPPETQNHQSNSEFHFS